MVIKLSGYFLSDLMSYLGNATVECNFTHSRILLQHMPRDVLFLSRHFSFITFPACTSSIAQLLLEVEIFSEFFTFEIFPFFNLTLFR